MNQIISLFVSLLLPPRVPHQWLYIYVLQLVVLFSFSVVDNLTDPGEGKKDIHVGQYIICMTSFQDPDMQDPTLQVGEPKATPKNNLICSLLF